MTRPRRLPGERLHRFAKAVFSRQALDDVAIPALADLQHESALVADAGFVRRSLVLGRGYAASGWRSRYPSQAGRHPYAIHPSGGARWDRI